MHRPWLNPCKIISNVNGTLGTNAIMSGILVYPGKGDNSSSVCGWSRETRFLCTGDN